MFPKIDEILICRNCKQLLHKPVECCQCFSLYCEKCFHECLNCKNKTFQVNTALENLLKQLHLTCFECGKNQFKNKKDLQNHLNSIHNKEEYRCISCDMIFKFKKIFIDHLLFSHQKIIFDIFDGNSLFNRSDNNNYIRNLLNQTKSLNESSIPFSENHSLNDKEIIINIDNNPIMKDDLSDLTSNNSSIFNYQLPQKLTLTPRANQTIISCSLINNSNRGNVIDVEPYMNYDNKTIDFEYYRDIFIINISKLDITRSFNCPVIVEGLCHCIQKVLTCRCCPDRICKAGNCFCSYCMKKNRTNKIKKNQLYNKENRIATKYGGSYYCNISFIAETKSMNKLRVNLKCIYPSQCPACKDLSDNLSMYKDLDL